MVTDLLLIILNLLVAGIVAVLPPWNIGLDAQPFNIMFGHFTSYNSVLPVAEVFYMSNLALSLFVGMHIFKWAKGAFNAVRGSGA